MSVSTEDKQCLNGVGGSVSIVSVSTKDTVFKQCLNCFSSFGGSVCIVSVSIEDTCYAAFKLQFVVRLAIFQQEVSS